MQNEAVICRVLYGLYAVKSRRLRQIIRRLVTRLENGEVYSETLRRIYHDYYHIEAGLYSYGCFDEYRIGAFTKIGRYCSFAEGVCVFTRNHPLEFVSTHPFFFNAAFGYVQRDTVARRGLVIGNDVWIGRNAMILPSVERIGDGAVVGAGAVVTHDVPDFSVAVGNPAEIIKYRFSEQQRLKIKQSQWWDKDIEQLKDQMSLLNSAIGKSFEDNEV